MKKLTTKQIGVLLKQTVVRDKAGAPLRVYRGEYGLVSGGSPVMETQLGSYSFGDPETASVYALEPNNANDRIESPRIYPVYLIINKPFFNDPGDSFVDFDHLEERLGRDVAVEFFLRYAAKIEMTNNWQEEINPDSEWGSVRSFFESHPERMSELYMELFPLLDDPDFVAILRSKGFDGAVYCGSGVNAVEDEYRVFDRSGIIYALSQEMEPRPKPERNLQMDEYAA
jgi:hypothetical protein